MCIRPIGRLLSGAHPGGEAFFGLSLFGSTGMLVWSMPMNWMAVMGAGLSLTENVLQDLAPFFSFSVPVFCSGTSLAGGG